MAKKNKAILVGQIDKILEQNLFTLKVRKNPRRFIFPIIELEEEILEKYKNKIVPETLAIIEGRVTTEQKEEIFDCPNPDCKGKITDKYIFTKVTAENISILKVDYREIFLNNIILLGTVCREKTFVYIEGTRSPLGNTRYQIAVNRRMPNETDYPWIASYARQAEEDAKRIQVGSQVLIDGTINTRRNIKECECSLCSTKIEVTEFLSEIVASSVEYLNNCIF